MALRVTTRISGLGGSPGYSRQHFGFTGDESEDDAVLAASAVADMWEALNNMIYVGVTMQIEPEVQRINPATGTVTGAFVVDEPAIVGSSPDTPLPWSTQGLLQLRTGVYSGGREVRGRIFVPGVTSAVNALGRPTSTGRDILNAGGAALLASGTGLPVVLSGGQAVPVTTITGWSEWAYLGSRRD